MSDTYSSKSRFAACLLCVLFGIFGAHRFYVGKVATGILQLITLGGIGIWSVCDLILIIVGGFTDKEGKVLYYWFEDLGALQRPRGQS